MINDSMVNDRKEKICPFMSHTIATKYGSHLSVFINCQREKCALWTNVYTTEGRCVWGCSQELKTNADGLLVV